MDYKQFEGHTVGTNDFLVRNLREYANDFRVVNGILPKQDIVRAADLIESLKLELQKQKELNAELVKALKRASNFIDNGQVKADMESLIKQSSEI